MSIVKIKLLNKNRNKISIIKDRNIIDKENFIRRQHLEMVYPHLKLQEDERREKERQKKLQKERDADFERQKYDEDELAKRSPKKIDFVTYKPVFSQEFVFTNIDQLIEIDLNKLSEPSVPISIAKEEIQKAYEKGVADGLMQTKVTFQIEVEKYQTWIKRIESVTDELQKKFKVEMKQLESMLIDLSLGVAKHLISQEILINSDIVINQVKKAIDSLDEDKIFKLHLNPGDVEILKAVHSTLLPNELESKSIIITPDSSVDRGGCVLETSAGYIDGRISSQLEALSKTLKQTQQKYLSENDLDKEIKEINKQKQIELIKEKEKEIELQMREEWGDEFFEDFDEIGDMRDNNDENAIKTKIDKNKEDNSTITNNNNNDNTNNSIDDNYDDINDLIFGQ